MIRSHDFLCGHTSYLLLEQTIFFQKHQSLKSIDTVAYLIYHLLLWGVGTRQRMLQKLAPTTKERVFTQPSTCLSEIGLVKVRTLITSQLLCVQGFTCIHGHNKKHRIYAIIKLGLVQKLDRSPQGSCCRSPATAPEKLVDAPQRPDLYTASARFVQLFPQSIPLRFINPWIDKELPKVFHLI